MWCTGCQRGQKPDNSSRCPVCKTFLGIEKEKIEKAEKKQIVPLVVLDAELPILKPKKKEKDG